MKEEKNYCKKIVANAQYFDKPLVIYGIVISDENEGEFLIVKTRKRTYSINKRNVLSIVETDRVFEGDQQ